MIKILLFAHLQEAVGQAEISWVDLPKTVGILKEKLKEEYHINLHSVMVAVNEEYADDHLELKNGDTIALIPPVSGG